MPHFCDSCKKIIVCETDRNSICICDCEMISNIENKNKKKYYFCNSANSVFPSCYELFLIKKYNVEYTRLIALHRKL